MAANSPTTSLFEDDSPLTDQCTIDGIPAEIILKILSLLPIGDLPALAGLGSGCRLGRLAADPLLFRKLKLSRCYQLTKGILSELLSKRQNDILHLDMSNCYWLKPEDFASLDFRLPNLEYLDVCHTDIPFKTLHKLLSHAKTLQSLSYDQQRGIKLCDISGAAMRTLRRLTELNVVTVPGKCVQSDGERFLLEYGANYQKLEAFSLDSSYVEDANPSCSCCNYLNDVIPFENLKHVMIGRRARDAHNKSLDWSLVKLTANQSSVFLADGCFSQKESSPSKILALQMIARPDLKLSPFRNLRYLNIAGSVDFTGLRSVAENCQHLESLNLSFCRDALKKVYKRKEWTDLSAFRIFVEAKTPLKHLNISGLHPHLPDNEMCEVLAQIPSLRSLSLPICGLPERKVSVPVDDLTFGRIRSRTRSCSSVDVKCNNCSRSETGRGVTFTNESGKLKSCLYCSSDLSELVKGCSKLRSFELIKTGFVSYLSPRATCRDQDVRGCVDIMDPEFTLLSISRWRQLTSLVLAGVPSVFNGRSLVAVTQGCPLLRSLSLAHLGPHPFDQCLFMESLCEALRYAKELQDFRLEQPKMVGMKILLESLQLCTRLRRVCVISQCGRIKEIEELQEVMDKCPDLIVLQIICNTYFEIGTKWQQMLTDRYKASRPALDILIVSYKRCEPNRWRDICDKIPFVHLDELTLFQSRVANKVPTWSEIKAMRTHGELAT